MINYGQLISSLRKSKKITINELIGNKMHRTTYERFVRENTKISMSNLIYMLDQLHVSFDEFMLMINEENQKFFKYNDLIYQFKYAVMTKNIKLLKKIHNLIIQYQSKINDDNHIYQHLLIMVNLNLSFLSNQHFNKNDVFFIKNYLFSSRSWTTYELFVFENVMFIFNLDVIETLLPRITRHLFNKFEYIESQKIRVHIILKVIAQDIVNHKLNATLKLLNGLYQTIDNWDKYHEFCIEKISLIFLNGLVNFITFKNSKYKSQILESIRVIKFIDDEIYITAFSNYIKTINNIYNLKIKI